MTVYPIGNLVDAIAKNILTVGKVWLGTRIYVTRDFGLLSTSSCQVAGLATVAAERSFLVEAALR